MWRSDRPDCTGLATGNCESFSTQTLRVSIHSDLRSINEKSVSQSLKYLVTCPASNSYI